MIHNLMDYIQIVTFGIPATGVVCIHALNYSQTSFTTNHDFPLSLVVRTLTMFVGFIEWMEPADGNYKLCQRLKVIIQRVLDKLLKPSGPTLREESPRRDWIGADGNETGQLMPPGSLLDGLDGADCLEWLDMIDWVQTAQMDQTK